MGGKEVWGREGGGAGEGMGGKGEGMGGKGGRGGDAREGGRVRLLLMMYVCLFV